MRMVVKAHARHTRVEGFGSCAYHATLGPKHAVRERARAVEFVRKRILLLNISNVDGREGRVFPTARCFLCPDHLGGRLDPLPQVGHDLSALIVEESLEAPKFRRRWRRRCLERRVEVRLARRGRKWRCWWGWWIWWPRQRGLWRRHLWWVKRRQWHIWRETWRQTWRQVGGVQLTGVRAQVAHGSRDFGHAAGRDPRGGSFSRTAWA